MSDEEFLAICQRISTETHPAKLAKLIQELIKSLTDEDIPVKRPLAKRVGRAWIRPAPSSGSNGSEVAFSLARGGVCPDIRLARRPPTPLR